ncbi:MAG: diaminopimelate epimerase, partial [Parabacteroides sp.]|nr:diaminopimelate epimerase [Parabacteroides sp.]
KKEVRMRVWERGSGITSACGTGACATAVAAVINQKTDREVKIVMDGGPLTIKWDSATQKVFMTGDAVKVYEGELSL